MAAVNKNTSVQEPSAERLFRIAAGLDSLTREEMRAKQSSPWWTIKIAESHLSLLGLAYNQIEQDYRLKAIVKELQQLPAGEVRSRAFDYLHTLTPANYQVRLREVYQNSQPSPSRNKTWGIFVGLALAATLLMVVFTRFREIQQTKIVGQVLLKEGLAYNSKDISGYYHFGDVIDYQAEVHTPRKFAWLISVDDEHAYIRDFAVVDAGRAGLSHKMTLDARQCLEFFVVVVSDEPLLLPEPSRIVGRPTELASLSHLGKSLQSIRGQEGSVDEQAKRAILLALPQRGLSSEPELQVQHIKHMATARLRK